MTESYRQTFQSPRAADSYDEKVYRRGGSAEVLWRIEREFVAAMFVELRSRFSTLHYLDFACGTGRVISAFEQYADEATGIDVSPFMIERARERASKARFICKDISAPADEIEGRYDVITCFRFLTNAEPELRIAALKALALRLRDSRSRLIINCHSNPFSYRFVLLPYHWLKDRMAGRPLFGYLSNARATAEFAEAGLEVESVRGMGFYPEKLSFMLPSGWIEKIERSLTRIRLFSRFGLNQLFVCRQRVR